MGISSLRLQISSSIVLVGAQAGNSGCPCPLASSFYWPWGPTPPSWPPSGWRPLYMSPCTTCLASCLCWTWYSASLSSEGPGHLLVWSQVHQLLRLLPSDVQHEFLPCHGVLHVHGHGLWRLCGHLPSTEVHIHHHWPTCGQGSHFYFGKKFLYYFSHPHSLRTTPLLWERCHWELHLC